VRRDDDPELTGEAVMVRLDVPARPRSLRLLRLAAADAGASLGFDLARIECIRLVIDELASVLIGAADGGRMRFRITPLVDHALLEGSLSGAPRDRVVPDRIVRELLDGSIGPESWSIRQGVDGVHVRAVVFALRSAGVPYGVQG
jgi:hypothetical protein